jgi:hypothetical protein
MALPLRPLVFLLLEQQQENGIQSSRRVVLKLCFLGNKASNKQPSSLV